MTDRLRIALAQVNPTMGDIEGNAALIRIFDLRRLRRLVPPASSERWRQSSRK